MTTESIIARYLQKNSRAFYDFLDVTIMYNCVRGNKFNNTLLIHNLNNGIFEKAILNFIPEVLVDGEERLDLSFSTEFLAEYYWMLLDFAKQFEEKRKIKLIDIMQNCFVEQEIGELSNDRADEY